MTYLIIGLVGLSAVLAVALHIVCGCYKKTKTELTELTKVADMQKENLKVLQQYAGDVEKIKDEKQETVQKIERTESDADALAVVVDIIRSNNERVQNCERTE